MPSGQNEAFSCVLIDKALEFNGWDLLDARQVRFEYNTVSGRADYLLLDKLGRVLAVLEAKREDLDPYDAKGQARGYPFIQTGDVANSNGQITTHSQTYSEKGLAQSRMWPAGTLVITIAANIGKTALLTFPACFPDSMVGFIAGEKVIVDYVRHWLVTMESGLEKAVPQMAQKNINLRILSALTVPVPPLPLQKEFARRVAEIREMEAAQAACHQRLEALFQSLLHRAFNGEL